MALRGLPIPLSDPIARPRRPEFGDRTDPLEGTVTRTWVAYLSQLNTSVDVSTSRVNAVSVTTQAASISPTDFSGGALSEGLYRISYYARITRAAGTSSSLTVTLAWTESSIALSVAGAAMTGNAVTTVQSGSALILTDASSPITYATTYVSVGAPTMLYRASFTLEQVQA